MLNQFHNFRPSVFYLLLANIGPGPCVTPFTLIHQTNCIFQIGSKGSIYCISRIGYKSRPYRLQPTLDFAERHNFLAQQYHGFTRLLLPQFTHSHTEISYFTFMYKRNFRLGQYLKTLYAILNITRFSDWLPYHTHALLLAFKRENFVYR